MLLQELTFGRVHRKIFLSTYDGLEGLRANKTKFDLKYEGTPIYTKTFNPSVSGRWCRISKTTGIFTIPNHFFNTNEQLIYIPSSTFTGIAATAVINWCNC